MRFAGGKWRLVGKAGSSDRPGNDLVFKLDRKGVPYVAYTCYKWQVRMMKTDRYRAAVRRLKGGRWRAVGKPGFTAGEADYMHMAVDRTDVPWVVFRDGANAQRVTVMKFADKQPPRRKRAGHEQEMPLHFSCRCVRAVRG